MSSCSNQDMYLYRTFRLQAAVDIYLAQMRRIDDERAAETSSSGTSAATDDPYVLPVANDTCIQRRCGHYPHLAVARGTPSDPFWPKGSNNLIVHNDQIEAHTARRGGPIDRFDHPLIFARSMLKRYFVPESMRPQLEEEGPYFLPQEANTTESLDTTTFGGVVGLMRAVISRLPKSCRVQIRPEVLEETVKLGWERLSGGEEVEVVMAPPLRFVLLANGLI